MSEKKTTKREYYAMLKAIPAVADNENLVAFIDHELELLDKKAGAERKPTANQLENAKITADLLDTMQVGQVYSVGELMKLMGVETNQKMTHILTPLAKGDNPVLKRSEVKGKAYYSLV